MITVEEHIMIKIIQMIEVGYKSILCGFCALFTVGFIYYMFKIVDDGMTYKDKKDKAEREG